MGKFDVGKLIHLIMFLDNFYIGFPVKLLNVNNRWF